MRTTLWTRDSFFLFSSAFGDCRCFICSVSYTFSTLVSNESECLFKQELQNQHMNIAMRDNAGLCN